MGKRLPQSSDHSSSRTTILEACVETLEEAIKAEQLGAHRLELCSRLDLDGLTPGIELTKQVLDKVGISVKVMIRPRAGDFVYTNQEFQQMKEEIISFRKLRIIGVVFGILDENNKLNLPQLKMLAELASPLEVTIHKAIDLTPNLLESVSELTKIQAVSSILTSGGVSTAMQGAETLRKMINCAGDSLTIIAAGRITKQNLAKVHQQIGAREYHGRRIVGEL